MSLLGNDPPAKPEALRLLAPQRGLFAIASCNASGSSSRPNVLPAGVRSFSLARPHGHKPNARKCQTLAATPAKPGDLLKSVSAAADPRVRVQKAMVKPPSPPSAHSLVGLKCHEKLHTWIVSGSGGNGKLSGAIALSLADPRFIAQFSDCFVLL